MRHLADLLTVLTAFVITEHGNMEADIEAATGRYQRARQSLWERRYGEIAGNNELGTQARCVAGVENESMLIPGRGVGQTADKALVEGGEYAGRLLFHVRTEKPKYS